MEEEKRNLLIWIGDFPNIDSNVYNCNYYVSFSMQELRHNWKNPVFIKQLADCFNHILIHFDGFYLDFLGDMIRNGMNTNHYEIRVHGVDKYYTSLFYSYRNKHWHDQKDWFKRGEF